MVRFIPAEELKKRYDVLGHFTRWSFLETSSWNADTKRVFKSSTR